MKCIYKFGDAPPLVEKGGKHSKVKYKIFSISLMDL